MISRKKRQKCLVAYCRYPEHPRTMFFQPAGLYESTYDRSSVQLIKDGYHSIQYFLNCSCLLTLSLRTCKGLLTDKLVENPKLQPCARHHSRNRFDTSLMSNDVKAWHVQKGRNLMIHDAVNAVSVMLMMIQQANMMHDDTTI